METQDSEKLFAAALARVESKSIQKWASSEHNKPIWLKITVGYVGKPDAEHRLAIDIMTQAIGL